MRPMRSNSLIRHVLHRMPADWHGPCNTSPVPVGSDSRQAPRAATRLQTGDNIMTAAIIFLTACVVLFILSDVGLDSDPS